MNHVLYTAFVLNGIHNGTGRRTAALSAYGYSHAMMVSSIPDQHPIALELTVLYRVGGLLKYGTARRQRYFVSRSACSCFALQPFDIKG